MRLLLPVRNGLSELRVATTLAAIPPGITPP